MTFEKKKDNVFVPPMPAPKITEKPLAGTPEEAKNEPRKENLFNNKSDIKAYAHSQLPLHSKPQPTLASYFLISEPILLVTDQRKLGPLVSL
ncbi:MAG: hypothetical protein QXP42_01920 [Candidatus Micrarchaeia archaeon]